MSDVFSTKRGIEYAERALAAYKKENSDPDDGVTKIFEWRLQEMRTGKVLPDIPYLTPNEIVKNNLDKFTEEEVAKVWDLNVQLKKYDDKMQEICKELRQITAKIHPYNRIANQG